MAYRCTNAGNCRKCRHFRYDEEKGKRVCWANDDGKKGTHPTFAKIGTFNLILDYADFTVLYDRADKEYLYIENGESPEAVELIAQIDSEDVLEKSDAELAGMFDNICCGEHIDSDGNTSYMWFKEKEDKKEKERRLS